jgi:DNA-binding CsgD family transcriptional regulator
MPGHAERTPSRATAPDGRAGYPGAEIYDRHAATVYRQALLMLGDERQAGRIAREVIVAECALPPAAPRDASRVTARLAVSTMRRCQELTAGRVAEERTGPGRHARGRLGLPDPQAREQALLGLVLFGGMGYHEAARELGISPPTAAAMLRSALIRLGTTPQGTRAPLPAEAAGSAPRRPDGAAI